MGPDRGHVPVVGPVMCRWNAILAESLSSQTQYKDLGIILQALLVENLESPTSLNTISLFQVIFLWELFLCRDVQSHDIRLICASTKYRKKLFFGIFEGLFGIHQSKTRFYGTILFIIHRIWCIQFNGQFKNWAFALICIDDHPRRRGFNP